MTPGTLSGVVQGDDVKLSAVATFEDAQIGTGKRITVVYSLSGAHASKYIAPSATVLTNGEITKKSLTISNQFITKSKTYDGTNTSSVTVGPLVGVVPGESVSVHAIATYDTAAVGTGKKITVTYTLTGADANKYVAPPVSSTTGEITKKELTVAGLTVANKEYDGTNEAKVTFGNLIGVIGNEEVVILSARGVFVDANVGTNKGVVIAYTIAGAHVGNYSLPNGSERASITPKIVTVPTPVLASATGSINLPFSTPISGLIAQDIVVVKNQEMLTLGKDYIILVQDFNVAITFLPAAKLAQGHEIAIGIVRENYEINGDEWIVVTNAIPSIIPQEASLWTNIEWGGNIVSYKHLNTLYLTLQDGTDGLMRNFTSYSNSEKLSNEGITKVVILEGIETIGDFAFFNNKLTSITIPESVLQIGDGSFGFNQLTWVTIPKYMRSIGDIAFGSNKLETVIFEGWVHSISERAFDGNGKNNTSAPIESYKTPGALYLNETTKTWVKQ